MTRVSASFLPPVALDRRSGVPMHRQLSEWFRHAIIGGQLRPGQRVPSTRSLAKELKISRLPVLSAYEQLFAEGYLETFTGAGTCVAQSIPGGQGPSAHTWAPEPVEPSAARPVSRLATLMQEPPPPWLANQGAFRVGLPALDHFPREIWSKLVNRHARRMPTELMTYGDPIGYLPFREAIAQYLGTVRGVRCDASQILVTTGSQQGLLIATLALLEPKARVWMEEPGYPGALQALQSVGAQIVPVPVDDEGLDVTEGIRRSRNARAAYISPSHQFPLGVTMSATRRIQLLNWAARNGSWIIEDDYDSEYRLAGHPIASLQGLDTDARVIYVGTFSKVVFPALRLGYVVVPRDVMPAFLSVRNGMDTFSSTLYQLVMTDFIREGHFARHIRRMRALYMERRTALLESIETHMRGRLDIIGAEAGMQLVALLPPGIDDVAISLAAARQGVSVRPLSMCYANPPARGGLIFGYGGANVREIRESIRKLKSCF